MLTATFNSYGSSQISTPTKSITLNPETKKSAQLITSATGRPILNLVQIHPLGLLGKWVKCKKNYFYFIYNFFLQLAYRSDLLMDFHSRSPKRREITQGRAFLASVYESKNRAVKIMHGSTFSLQKNDRPTAA